MNKNIIVIAIFILSLVLFHTAVQAIPPIRIITTSISTPPDSGTPEKVIEARFYINESNQVTLQSLSIKNLSPTVINTASTDYRLEIVDSSNQILFHTNILVILNPQTGVSNQYYAIPYPNGARYLNFYYKDSKIAQYDIPQEFPMFYLILGIVSAVVIMVVAFVIYYVRKNYTIKI